jgi:trigger factor
MEKVFHDNGNGTLNVSVTYDPNDYQPIVIKVMDKLCTQVTVKGFRTGKAPKDIAMRYIKSEDVYNGMVDKLIDRDFMHLLDDYENIKEVANIKPSLNVNFDDKKKVYNFLYTFVFLPKAEVKKASGYNIKVETKDIKDEDVENEVKKMMSDAAELVPSKEAAANGDHVVIDFQGYVDGKPFDGGSANDYELTLGSHSFVPGFEEALIGIKEGDKKNVDITFPKDYLASLAEKPAKFVVTCKGVKKVILPKEDDEFASEQTDYKDVKTLEDLKKAIKAKLIANAEATAKTQTIDGIFKAIIADAKPVIADQYLELAASQVQENQISQFKQMGLGLDEYLKIAGVTLEKFKENAKNIAKDDAVKFAVTKSVAALAKLEATQEEVEAKFGGKEKYDELMKAAAAQQAKNPNFSVSAYLEQVKDEILNAKVNDYLLANNAAPKAAKKAASKEAK